MKNWQSAEIVVTGLGVTAAVGQGKVAFLDALMEGRSRFGVMTRKGRQKDTAFLGAEIASLVVPERFAARDLRTASLSAQAALVTIDEAWCEANLTEVDPDRIGLVVGGSNFQQRELSELHERHMERPHFLRPTYGVNFMDTDVCGLCTAQFGIKGISHSVGAASASGQMAVIQAAQQVQSGMVDVCIAVGALMDLSYWELIALRGLGAMGTDRYADRPKDACRPFDQQRDGFIFGEVCAAVVIERADGIVRPKVNPYAKLSGWGVAVDGNRNPDSSLEGEMRVINQALKHAGLAARDMNYVNPHGSASRIGDEVELQAIRTCGLDEARINTTKSIIGHGLSAAGAAELVATILQMNASRLHPCVNLEQPIGAGFGWVRNKPEDWKIENAMNLSYGFGGINTAVCVSNWHN